MIEIYEMQKRHFPCVSFSPYALINNFILLKGDNSIGEINSISMNSFGNSFGFYHFIEFTSSLNSPVIDEVNSLATFSVDDP